MPFSLAAGSKSLKPKLIALCANPLSASTVKATLDCTLIFGSAFPFTFWH